MKRMFYYAAAAISLVAVSFTTACVYKPEGVKPVSYVLTVPDDDVFGIPIDGTFASISDSVEVVESGEELLEGDPYHLMVVKVADGLNVRIGFDGALPNGESGIYYFETHSSRVQDPYGLRVGSELGHVMDVWPNGHFVTGLSDKGKYARYATDSAIIFSFDPSDLEESCFQVPEVMCNPPRAITVESIFVYPGQWRTP